MGVADQRLLGILMLVNVGVATAGDCVAGLSPVDLLGGDLGTAPAGLFQQLMCLEVRNDLPTERSETAYSGVPLPESLGLAEVGNLALVGPGDRIIAAQFNVLSRWGGPVGNTALPIRWLQVAAPVRVAASGLTRYALRLYDAAPTPADPFAVQLTPEADGWRVDTGLATFMLDPALPGLIRSITADIDNDGAGRVSVYQDSAGSGPRLVFVNAAGADVAIGAASARPADPDRVFADSFEAVQATVASSGPVMVDVGSFEVVESGPVKASVLVRGHFPDPGGDSVCTPGTTAPYESLGYTAVFTFFRASRDLGLSFEFRNECSDALSGPFTDQTLRVREVSWSIPLNLQSSMAHGAGDQAIVSDSGLIRVSQQRGSGDASNWRRRARVELNGNPSETAEYFGRPVVGVSDGSWAAAATLPWMRFREPQSLTADGSVLRLEFVGDTLVVGEGKGIWNEAHLAIAPTAMLPGTPAQFVEGRRDSVRQMLERGLLMRAPVDAVNASGVFPSLGNQQPSTIKSNYLAWMNLLHDETVLPGGQHDRNASYGSQLWPDTGSSDPFAVDAGRPNDISSGMNYWDPAGNELVEYLRSGDPKWLWDFALAGVRTQMHSAYLNTGQNNHGTRAGFAVTSGGPGCANFEDCEADGTAGGQWHRSAFGSDDYTYDMGFDLGYVLRPSATLRDRFAQAGRTAINRYDTAVPEASREAFVNAINITRQVIQHFELLANCAEFVPGQQGQDCDSRLHQLMEELARDNLAAGILCQGEVNFNTGLNGDLSGPLTQCFAPQQFMQNALMYGFFHRYWRNYGDPAGGSVRRALVDSPRVLYEQGIAQLAGGALDLNGDWAAGIDCQLGAGGTSVVSCTAYPDSDNMTAMGFHTKPHTAALLLMAHEIEPTLGYCQLVRDAYDVSQFSGAPSDFNGFWNGVGHFNQAGWWKGVAQMLQGMAFGVGIYDTCTDPP